MLNYNYFEQLKDLFNGFLPLIVMSVLVYLTGLVNIGEFPLIVMQVIVGMISYVAVSALTKNDSFIYALEIVKSFIKRK